MSTAGTSCSTCRGRGNYQRSMPGGSRSTEGVAWGTCRVEFGQKMAKMGLCSGVRDSGTSEEAGPSQTLSRSPHSREQALWAAFTVVTLWLCPFLCESHVPSVAEHSRSWHQERIHWSCFWPWMVAIQPTVLVLPLQPRPCRKAEEI